MAMPKSSLLVLLACALMLEGCAHSRVVERNYPDESSSTRTRAVRTSPPRMSRAAPAPIPFGATHVVSRGETLYGISFRFGLRYQDVAAWNGISEPYVIEVGQRLRLQAPASQAIATRPVAAPPPIRGNVAGSATTVAPPVAPSTPTPSASRTPATAVIRPPVAPVTVPTVEPVMQPAAGTPAWHWPARGQIIGRYVSGDQTQQGINIAGSAGQNIAAAADGVVVYSGAGLVGYGELIIIKHSDE